MSNYLFSSYNLDLDFKDYDSSNLSVSIQRVSNDTYLKIFSPYVTQTPSIRPQNFDKLQNKIKLSLNHEKFDLESGMETYETVKASSSDKYQFILPYYNLDWFISQEYFDGSFNFTSLGSNDLNNTNRLETSVVNDLIYSSNDIISNLGFKTN